MLGFRIGKSKSYEAIEKMYLNQIDYQQRATSYSGNVATFRGSDFVAYLKFSHGETVELIKSKDRNKLWEDLVVLNKKIDTLLIDNSKK